MTLSGTITAAALITDFDASRAALDALFSDGDGYQIQTFVSAGSGVYDFTPAGDCELVMLAFAATHTSSTAVVTLGIAAANADERYTHGRTWSTTLTLSGVTGTEDKREVYTSTDRLTLRGGVTYRLTLATVGAGVSSVQAWATTRLERRTR